MKKLLLTLLILLLLPLLSFAESTIYASDFSSGTDGWFPRSTGGVKLLRVNETLMVTGRAGSWHSPGREFALESGKKYWFSVDVMEDTAESAEFILSIEHTKNGTASYENLSRASASRKSWVTIYGSWEATAYDQYVLYIETNGNPTMNFYIKDFKVYNEDPQILTQVSYEGDLPILKDIYANYFDIGTCVSQVDVRNSTRMSFVKQQCSIVTPENELKPDAVLDVSASRKLAIDDDTAVAVRFDGAKPLLNYAKDNGLKVHGHVFVWHQQTPAAFFHVGYDTGKPLVTREVLLARLDNYIRLVFEYMNENYPGVIVSWDVVNEAVSDNSSALRTSNWTTIIGADFVNRAFEIADRYAPDDVMLYYNDYSTPYEPKLTGILNLLSSLVEEGHIDGYGFQSHYSWNDPSIDAIKKAFDKVQALGLKLRVSELDIKINANTDSTRSAQAQRYTDLFKLYLSYDIEAVQFWGVNDSTSWISSNYPLLFDANQQPKPAFWSVAELLDVN